MAEIYNQATARHYAAYRPELHLPILQKAVDNKYKFGLDIGCGTGASSVALAQICGGVVGVEPSASMLALAAVHEKIEYVQGSADWLPVDDGQFDIVTLAGVLHYVRQSGATPALVKELVRVCKPDAHVIAYDFKVLMDDILQAINLRPESELTDYDHLANLTGFDNLEVISSISQTVTFDASHDQIAHIVLSSSYNYRQAQSVFGVDDPFKTLVKRLQAKQWPCQLQANIYYSLYHLKQS